MKTVLVIEVTHTRPIPDLEDIAAGRIYTMDNVEDVRILPKEIEGLKVYVMPEEKKE